MFGASKPTTTASAFPQATANTGTSIFGGGAPAASNTFQTGQPQQQGFSGFSFPQAQPTSQPGGGFQLPTATSTVAPNVSLFSSTLGAGQAKPAGALGFGMPAQAAPAAQPTLGFGGFNVPKTAAPTSAAPSTGFSFGLSAPVTSTGQPPALNFGLGSNTAVSAAPVAAVTPLLPTSTPGATTGFTLGTTPAFGTTTGLNVAATSAPTSNTGFNLTSTGFINLGASATSTPSAAPTFNMATSTPGTLGFNLGATPATTGQAGLSFAATTATSTPTLSFGLGSTLTAASTAAPAFGQTLGTAVTSSAPSSIPTLGGLGGSTAFNIGKGMSIAAKADQLKGNPLTSLTAAPNQIQANYKDDLIPQELMVLVESFKTFVKDQKSSSSVVNRASLKQITKVTEDAELLKRKTMQLERTVNKNKALNRKLREDVARGIQDSEIVQRLSMDPQGFPTDNTLAFEYFRNIVDRFQHQAESLTVELKNMEKHIVCKLNPSPFTPEELSAIMKQLYECFVALAGRYQSIHSSVTSLKLEMQRKKDPWYALNSNVNSRQRHY